MTGPYFYEALSAITGSNPPDFFKSVGMSSQLDNENFLYLKSWCLENSKLNWASGTGIIKAADRLVAGAISKGNI